MQARTTWKEKMLFSGEAEGLSVTLDAKAPIGTGQGMTPKELVAIGLCGCTAMDVVALMKKHKQPLEAFDVSADIETTSGVHPAVFKKIQLTFDVKGAVDAEKLKEAVHLSQTKYCGVSAMMAKAAPIHYKILLNGEAVGSGESRFA